jgi:hypothetical protein
MSSLFHHLTEETLSEILLGTGIAVLLIGGMLPCDLPAWLAFGFGPLAGLWTVYIVRGARRSHVQENGPLPPRTVLDTLRLHGIGVLCVAIIGYGVWLFLQ